MSAARTLRKAGNSTARFAGVCGKLNLFITPYPRGVTVARLIFLSFAALALAALAPFCGAAEPVLHPLDALTAPEYWAVFETMKAYYIQNAD